MMFDIVIVGGGSAGSILAGRLSEDERLSVLVLESGPTDIAGMMFNQGHPSDYDRWAALGADGWDHASLEPYFQRLKAQRAEGLAFDGPTGALARAWLDAAALAGLPGDPDLCRTSAEGADVISVCRIPPAKARPNLHIEPGAASRILVRDGRAVGVDYRQGDQSKTALAARGVILSAGATGTPRLLLGSGIGPGQHLQEMGVEVALDLPGVGRNLQTVANAQLTHTVRHEVPAEAWARLIGELGLAGGAPTAPIGRAQAFARTRPDAPAPNVHIVFSPFAFEMSDGRVRLRDQPCISQSVAALRPASRGTISLRSPDLNDRPAVDHRLFEDEDDLEQLVDGVLAARRIVGRPALDGLMDSEIRPGPEVASREALKTFVRSTAHPYHTAGTCRMGQDADAVVDPALRVRGIEGLWIADASVMPAIPAGNIQAAAAMIGAKGADLILADLAR